MLASERAERDRARRPSRATLWVAWVAGTAVAAMLGLAVADAPVIGQPDYSFVDDNAIFPLALWGCGLVLLVGPLVGLAQGVVLRFLAQMKDWQRWIGVTSLGVFLTEIVGTLLGVATAGAGAGFAWAVLPGFIVGFLQQLVLRREVQAAGWWIIASGSAWIAGVAAGVFVSGILFSQVAPAFPFHPIESALKWAVGWCVGAAVYGALSGAVLLWLLSRRTGVHL